MNKRVSLTLTALILVLLFGGMYGSARAATAVDVVIHNDNPITITLSFVGLKVYQFEVEPGKSTVQLEPGTYTHSYYGCGKLNFGSVTVKPKDNDLTIPWCETGNDLSKPGEGTALLNIRNFTFTTFPVYLHGVDNNTDYDITLVPGANKVYVAKGFYTYSYFACSAVHFGTVMVPGKGAEMDVSSCSSNLNGAGVTDQLTTFKVKNNSKSTVILVMNGLVDYVFTITGSAAYLTVEKGYYTYTMYACGTTYDGEIQITPNDVLIRTPYCTQSPE